MNKETFYLYKNAIQSLYPEAWGVYEPKNTGSQNNVVFATVGKKSMVFKFGDKKLVKKNEEVSKLYRMRGIPVPQITARCKNGLYFEEYEKIKGLSLHEAIHRGMTKEQIKQVYRDVIICFEKMNHVHPCYVNSNLTSSVHEVEKINISNANGKLVGNIFKCLIYLLNIGRDKALYHSCITPKNIIVDKDGKFESFIDVDSVNICSKEYAFQMMATKYHELGFDINDLITFYRNTTHDLLQEKSIQRNINMLASGKKLLWQMSQRKKSK